MQGDSSDQVRLRELEAELQLVRRDRDAANLRLLARRLTDAMARCQYEERLSRSQLAFAKARERVQQMEASTSWRITRPLRAVMRRIRGEAPPTVLPEHVDFKPLPVPTPPVSRRLPAPPQTERPSLPARPSLDLPDGPSRVAVLLAGNVDPAGLARCVASAHFALHRAGSTLDVTVAARGGMTRAYNLLLQDGFTRGAEVCVIADPRGLFHPDAIRALLGVLALHDHCALIDALQFPDPHPKGFDPLTLETPWAGRHCMAISREAFDALGGFDEELGNPGQDAELSRRASALGWPVLTAPHALFLIDRTDEAPSELSRATDPPNSLASRRDGCASASQAAHAPSGSA